MNNYFKLASKSEFGVKAAYVENGDTPEARRGRQLDEQFRLCAEFLTLRKHGWKIAMATLTYDNRFLPTLPKCLFQNPSEYESVPCFSRKDAKRWIDSVRHHYKYHNQFTGDRRIRYFIATEYGDITHRPHLHAVLAWPPEVSYEEMHAVCSYYWTNGILFPRNPQGDWNPRQQKKVPPFEIVGDAIKALSYVSKYVCKDISYMQLISKYSLNKKLRIYKDCAPFYMQSRSLGYSAIKDLTDEEKLDIYQNGLSFEGQAHRFKCPVYIKNRLIYDNVYMYTQDGRRMVRRQSTEFFEKYKRAIFLKKSSFYNKLLNREVSVDYLVKAGMDTDYAKRYVAALEREKSVIEKYWNRPLSKTFGDLYLCYANCSLESCYVTHNLHERIGHYMRRYHVDEVVNSEVPHINYLLWKAIQVYCSLSLGMEGFISIVNLDQRIALEQRNKRVLAYFNDILGV